MKNQHFVNTLKDTLNKLEQKNAWLLSELNNTQSFNEYDPEISSIHDIWHTYKLQTEFKEFIESLLQKQVNIGKAV